LDGTIENEIQASLVDGRLQCAVAFKIAKKLKVAPKQVGDAANRLNIKITSCQLGCFP
jgi:molybdate transport system regulatory protein